MPELQYVAICRIELINDAAQATCIVLETRWTLKEKATEVVAELESNRIAKLTDQGSGPAEPFLVGDRTVDLDRVNKARWRLPFPGLDCGALRPAVKRRIQFYGIEMLSVMVKPTMRFRFRRIEHTSPVPVEPA
jgi:hypothetical protein